MVCEKHAMRREYLFAAIVFGGLLGFASGPLPSFAFQTADQRSRIEQPLPRPVMPVVNHR
jgi:hypothetical protein